MVEQRSMGARVATGTLSLIVPGLGQAVQRRVLDGLLLLAGTLVPYIVFLMLLNLRFGVPGELLSFSPFDAPHPLRPPAEHWSLFLLGGAIHAAAVWDAARGKRGARGDPDATG